MRSQKWNVWENAKLIWESAWQPTTLYYGMISGWEITLQLKPLCQEEYGPFEIPLCVELSGIRRDAKKTDSYFTVALEGQMALSMPMTTALSGQEIVNVMDQIRLDCKFYNNLDFFKTHQVVTVNGICKSGSELDQHIKTLLEMSNVISNDYFHFTAAFKIRQLTDGQSDKLYWDLRKYCVEPGTARVLFLNCRNWMTFRTKALQCENISSNLHSKGVSQWAIKQIMLHLKRLS